jgi:ABC-type lipoprotein export system ATPase subunit
VNLISATAVTRLWDGVVGLHPIDLQLASGELVVLRGRSGSGKSTLLAVLAGLCAPDSGEVLVDGDVPNRVTPWSTIALVPQVLALAVELSVRENITDSARDARPEVVDDLLATLRLTEMAARAVTEISMGQQQRVAVARAIAASPRLLLADEPTSFQDDLHTGIVIGVLRAAADAGAGVVVATHDHAVIAAADRVIDIHAV